jgi:GNAT superfamily N-acetyltransferase
VATVRLVKAEPDTLLDTVFSELLTPAFTPDELGTVDQMRASVRAGISRVLVALDDSDKPVAVAVGEWSAATRTVLLGYLAVSEHSRSGGIGGQLLEHALRAWRQELDPRVMLTELEHPAAHPANPGHGDPAARLRFYARHRTRALDVPYFQPALGPGRHRVHGLVLAALWVGPAGTGAAPDTVDGALVREFMAEYFEETEGKVPDDPAARALFAALDRPDGIPLLPLDEPAGLPVSVPE